MADQSESSNPGRLAFVFDNMRSRSHLFFRWISTSPELVPVYHPFSIAAFLGPERYPLRCNGTEETKKRNEAMFAPFLEEETYEESINKFTRAVANAQTEGKTAFANGHGIMALKQDVMFPLLREENSDFSQSYPNPTVIPDDLFNTLLPIMVIRHPVIAIDSIVRTIAGHITSSTLEQEYLNFPATIKPCRYLYDVFCSQGRKPLVVDGDDVLWRTDEIAKAVCDYIGIDFSGVKETWTPYTEQERPNGNAYFYQWTKTNWESEGIERPDQKPTDPDLERSYKEWEGKYGKDIADGMKKFALKNTPDYEYLVGFKA